MAKYSNVNGYDFGSAVNAMANTLFYGPTGSGVKTMVIPGLYVAMWTSTPANLRIAYVHWNDSNLNAANDNPFAYADPANAVKDLKYARLLIYQLEDVVQERSGREEKFFDILLVVDNVSAVIEADQEETPLAGIENDVLTALTNIAKNGPAVGVHLLLIDQTIDRVPAELLAHIPAQVAVGPKPHEFVATLDGQPTPLGGVGEDAEADPAVTEEYIRNMNSGLKGQFQYVTDRLSLLEFADEAAEEA